MKTNRRTFERLIGYNFGNMIYDGCYYDVATNKKQYFFLIYGNGMNSAPTENYLTDYKGFREVIDKYDIPKR